MDSLQLHLPLRDATLGKAPDLRPKILKAWLSELPMAHAIDALCADNANPIGSLLAEEAIAKAYGATLSEVQRANMLLGDIGETLKLALAEKLSEAKMRLFHPLGFMLASPAESAEEALSYFEEAAVEDKYDGIRAQAHCAGGDVRLVHASKGKSARAEPVALRFEAGRAFLAGRFGALEDELAGMQAGGGYEGPGRSPDRADAMVWALTALGESRSAVPRVRRI